MHFQRSESALDSLKSVFNAFSRKPSLGAPGFYMVVVPLLKMLSIGGVSQCFLVFAEIHKGTFVLTKTGRQEI